MLSRFGALLALLGGKIPPSLCGAVACHFLPTHLNLFLTKFE